MLEQQIEEERELVLEPEEETEEIAEASGITEELLHRGHQIMLWLSALSSIRAKIWSLLRQQIRQEYPSSTVGCI